MRTALSAVLLLALLTITGCHAHPHARCGQKEDAMPLRHVVVFKFKETATKGQIQEIVDAFGKLPEKIDSIIDYEHGINISEEGLDQGFTHVFVVTFKDKAGLQAYLPHPAHKAFVAKLKPVLQEPFVVDYFAQ